MPKKMKKSNNNNVKALVESMLPKPGPSATKEEVRQATLITNFLTSGKGKELLAAGFTLESEGLWHVYGQDQSAGGMFDIPRIPDFGYYQGRLIDVLNEVVQKRDWNGWTNDGGEIVVGKIKRPAIKKV